MATIKKNTLPNKKSPETNTIRRKIYNAGQNIYAYYCKKRGALK